LADVVFNFNCTWEKTLVQEKTKPMEKIKAILRMLDLFYSTKGYPKILDLPLHSFFLSDPKFNRHFDGYLFRREL